MSFPRPLPRRTWLVGCALFAGTVLLFLRAHDYGFSNYDDPRYITENPHVQAGLTGASVAWAFVGKSDYWHPLTWVSHMVDWELHGADAGGHRLTSVLWHALNAVLAFLVLRRLTGAFWTSALSAAVFAWHPLRVESVIWISERKDVMSGCFFLLTLWAYAAYVARRSSGRSAWRWYLLTLGCFVGGLMSKPVIVTLPLVLLALDFWPLQRGRGAWPMRAVRDLVVEKLPFFALSAAIAVVTVVMQRHEGAFVLELPLGARIANAFVSFWRYVGNFFWPADLTPFYPHPGTWPAAIVVAAVAATLVTVIAAWRLRGSQPWVATGLVWFAAMLLPVIGVVQVGFQAMADRYMYLPTLGLQLALFWAGRGFAPRLRARSWLAPATAVALAAFALRTWDQQATWRDPVTLLQHAVAVTERNPFAEGFLAYTLVGAGRLDDAERHVRRALALEPRNNTAHYALAEIRTQQGRIDDAIASYREVLRLKPGDPDSEYKLGALLLRQGDTDAGLAHLKAAVERHPDFLAVNLHAAAADLQRGDAASALARYRLALALDAENVEAQFGSGIAQRQLGRFDEALAHFEAVLRSDAAHAPAHLETGLIHLERGRSVQALEHFRAALQIEPTFALAHLGLGRAAEQHGDTAEATAAFTRALELAPDNAQVHRVWADTLSRRRQFADAARHYRHAVDLQPGDAEARVGLGFALLLSGRRDQAIAQWEEALRLRPDFPGLRERLEKTRRP